MRAYKVWLCIERRDGVTPLEQKDRLVTALQTWLPEDERWDSPKVKADRALLAEIAPVWNTTTP